MAVLVMLTYASTQTETIVGLILKYIKARFLLSSLFNLKGWVIEVNPI
jgi:hypothetical protein